ncbi:MAG: hypothetical protein C4345_10995, partial [Chloroflexota bacterium]
MKGNRIMERIVLMAAERVAAEMINGVIVEADPLAQAGRIEEVTDEALSGTLIGDEVAQASALRRSVFEVLTHDINVEPSAVDEKAAAQSSLVAAASRLSFEDAQARGTERHVH